jgi:hypothetical protein
MMINLYLFIYLPWHFVQVLQKQKYFGNKHKIEKTWVLFIFLYSIPL